MTKDINCVFTMGGTYYLEERSVLAARRAAMKNLPLPEDRDYVDESLQLDDLDECMAANGWDYDEVEDLSKLSAKELTAMIDARIKAGLESSPDSPHTTTRLMEFLLDYYDILYPGFQPVDDSEPDVTPAEKPAPVPAQAPSQRPPCFVLYYKTYAGEENVFVFSSEDDARKSMMEDIESIKGILAADGYEAKATIENDDEAKVTAQDGDIYYEWRILQAKSIA